jgi:hypothetical protein
MQLAGTEDYIKKLDRIDHVAITNSLVKPENEETLKESISKLSEEQKEQVIRKYVRNKIAKVLRESYVMEQEDATDVVDTPEPADVDVPEEEEEAARSRCPAAVDSNTSSPAPTSFSGAEVLVHLVHHQHQPQHQLILPTSHLIHHLLTRLTK